MLPISRVNLVGNREYYMDCAEVNIVTTLPKRKKRKKKTKHAFKGVGKLPDIWKGNLKAINNCITEEGVPVVYPDPGSDVVYADGLSSSSAVSFSNLLLLYKC